MASARRSFGWAQDASNLDSLRRVIQVLIPGTIENISKIQLIEKYVVDVVLREKMIKALKNGGSYPYTLLKGTSGSQMTVEENMKIFGLDLSKAKAKTYKGGRANASCTGIIQISLPAQTKAYNKPYQSDWSAESYLKLAVSMGLLSWNGSDDTCTVTKTGTLIAKASSNEEIKRVYIEAVMTYPPAIRILQILSEDMLPHTKFEIGSKLGFIGEAGFDSLDTGYFLWFLASAKASSKKKIKYLPALESSMPRQYYPSRSGHRNLFAAPYWQEHTSCAPGQRHPAQSARRGYSAACRQSFPEWLVQLPAYMHRSPSRRHGKRQTHRAPGRKRRFRDRPVWFSNLCFRSCYRASISRLGFG